MNDKMDDKNLTYHRPISITVRSVTIMSAMRELPQETLMTANLKLDIAMQKEIVSIIRDNLDKEQPDVVLAITILGVS